MRVLIVDDHATVRMALKIILDEIAEIAVVEEAESGHEAIALTQQHQPDLIIMDYLMSNMNGIETTRIIHEQYPKIKIIILTASFDALLKQDALEAGASLLMSKFGSIDDILAAINSVFP